MIDTDKYERTTPELEEFEGETLGDTLTNLLTEIERLRKQLDHAHEWVLNTRWKTHDNYTDFVYFIEQTNKEESE